MPRANRHFLPGYIWHITHRVTKKFVQNVPVVQPLRSVQNLQIRTSIEDSRFKFFKVCRILGTLLTSWTNLDGGWKEQGYFGAPETKVEKFCLKVPCASFRSSDRDDLFIIAGSKS
jgi:hypothetical protein